MTSSSRKVNGLCSARDLVLTQERHPRSAFGMVQEIIPGPYHLGRAADAIVGAYRHHTTAVAGLLVELIEVQLDLLDKFRRGVIAALDQHNVVVAQRVGHDNEVLAVDEFDERLIAADIVDMIDVAQLLQ
jgi:hypothetical protein